MLAQGGGGGNAGPCCRTASSDKREQMRDVHFISDRTCPKRSPSYRLVSHLHFCCGQRTDSSRATAIPTHRRAGMCLTPRSSLQVVNGCTIAGDAVQKKSEDQRKGVRQRLSNGVTACVPRRLYPETCSITLHHAHTDAPAHHAWLHMGPCVSPSQGQKPRMLSRPDLAD